MEALICDGCARAAPKTETERWAARTTLSQETPVEHYCKPACEAAAAAQRARHALTESRPAALNRNRPELRLVDMVEPNPELATMPSPVSTESPQPEEA